ncbi:MAG: BON domain-containing protein [Silvibacterium sp.]|nr:BON domain-containing protein [Silvibacterium sp.]MBV8437011.1 BON domain-containing protein [Silvibacterium sp.]
MRRIIRSLVPIVVGFLLIGGSAALSTHSIAVAQASEDNNLRAEIMNKALNKSQLKNVQVSVTNGIAHLTGTVDTFYWKQEADKRVHRTKGVKGVDNEIEVAGPEISDQQLQDKLVKAIAYDRVGYGTTPFNAISVNVQNGAVTLGGTAYGPVDADSAVAVAENMKGVKDVINNISVDPVSPMDDRIRRAVYRAVYGFPSMNKYAIDPAQPIRISVQNGNVTLYGVVINQGDKDAAGIRANTVPGVFKVTNDLQVASQAERQ